MSLCKRLIGSLVTQWAGGFAKYGCSQDTVRIKDKQKTRLLPYLCKYSHSVYTFYLLPDLPRNHHIPYAKQSAVALADTVTCSMYKT